MMFDRARDQVPAGPEYSYRYLVNAMRRKIELATQQDLDEQRQRARKAEFEKLRSDVQIKLKFLDENRVKVKR